MTSEPKEPPSDGRWGYDLYPERKGAKYRPSWSQSLFLNSGKQNIEKFKCETRICDVLKESPLVKLMLGALKAKGCLVDLSRHITCEVCDPSVTGGYDSEINQVIICQNTAKSKGMVQAVLSHELTHMYDYCRANMDFKNIRHLACTEVRAANLNHCSFLSGVLGGDISPFSVKQQHRKCVRSRALASVMAIRPIDKAEAEKAVDEVFEKCYADMEPVGRRIRRNSLDMKRAYFEALHYGVVDEEY